MKKCMILANGKQPKKSVVNYFLKIGYDTIFCADGGANLALKLKIIPDFIIGDFDSIHKQTLKYFRGKSKIIHLKRQNDTDVEKCLKYAVKNKFDEAVLLGGSGDRLDHSFCNLGIILKFSDLINIKFHHEKSLLTVYSKSTALNTILNETISIYGIDEKTKIKSQGLKYPLNDDSLPFGKKESTSNVAKFGKVFLNIKNGKIFVIRDFNLMMKYGLV